MHRYYKWSLSSIFCRHNLYAFPSSTIMMPRPSHPRGFVNANRLWEEVKITKSLIKQFSSTSYHFRPLASNYTSQQPVLVRWLSDPVLPLIWEAMFTTTQKIPSKLSFYLYQFDVNGKFHPITGHESPEGE